MLKVLGFSAPAGANVLQSTFAYESTVKRWPRILTGIIDDLNKNFDACEGEKLAEAKKLISDLAALVNTVHLGLAKSG